MDVKKVQFNAQVTAFISLLEVFGNMTAVVSIAITKANTLVTFIHVGIFYLILLPHTFLMNTSHNKNRILEYGWKNVLLNPVGRPSTSQETTDDNAKKDSYNNNKSNKKETFVPNLDSNKIFMTRESLNILTSNIAKNRSTVKTNQTRVDPGDNEQNKNSSEEAVMNVIDIEEQEYQNEILRKLLSSMAENIDEKDKFMEHLNKLVVFRECYKQGKYLTELELESEILFNVR